MNSNNSSTGGPLQPTNLNGYLADDELEDFIQTWLAGLTGLKPMPQPIGGLVRPAYQAEPTPLPPYHVTWLAFNVVPGKLDWDASNTQIPANGDCPDYSRSVRMQEIRVDLTAIGPSAGSVITQFIMATGQGQNRELLRKHHFAFVYANEPGIVSIKSKGRFQRRVDLRVGLRRTIQFSYAVLPIAAASGEIISDAPTVEFEIGPGFDGSDYGDGGFGL